MTWTLHDFSFINGAAVKDTGDIRIHDNETPLSSMGDDVYRAQGVMVDVEGECSVRFYTRPLFKGCWTDINFHTPGKYWLNTFEGAVSQIGSIYINRNITQSQMT